METITLHSSIAEIITSDFAHPGLKNIRFVFTDDKPNANGVGIEYEDFPELIKSATGTPIKMRFLGKGVGGHERSIPVGYIQSLTENKLDDGTNQLIAQGTLFSEEYPDEIEWLAQEYDAGKAPGISWELSYHSKLLKDGVNWLKGIITRAATFVSNPAYGMRTAILALASDSSIPETELVTGISELIGGNDGNNNDLNNGSPKNTTQGGNSIMEEEIKTLKEQLAALQTQVSEKDAEIAQLSTDKDALSTSLAEKTQEISTYQNKELIATRMKALADAGITVEISEERLVKMDDEDFTAYVADLKKVADTAAAEAKKDSKENATRKGGIRIPRFDASSSTDEPEVSLAEKLHSFSRTRPEATE